MRDGAAMSDEASNADLAAMLRRWYKPLPAGECCLCLQPPEEACDEECRVPAMMLIANRLERADAAEAEVARLRDEMSGMIEGLLTRGTEQP